MSIRINTERIAALKPCADRFENFKREYPNFDVDILEFLSLEKITPADKIWVAVRVLPREIVEIFAIDCAFSTLEYAATIDAAFVAVAAAKYAAADADYVAANAEYVATAAHYAADYAADYTAERERQVDTLIYLIESEGV